MLAGTVAIRDLTNALVEDPSVGTDDKNGRKTFQERVTNTLNGMNQAFATHSSAASPKMSYCTLEA